MHGEAVPRDQVLLRSVPLVFTTTSRGTSVLNKSNLIPDASFPWD